jgi:DNA end-binding protein Ku
MPARAIDTASLSFGLVTIPVKIYSTNEPSHHISFNLLHAECGQRLHQKYVCPKHGEVTRDDMIKGYEYAKNKYVELTADELKALDAVASDAIELREFVPAMAIDPLYVDHSYYLGPDKGGEAAYRLIAEAMRRAELVGLASYSARGKQYVVMIRPFQDGVIMHQLRYPDEIKEWSEVPKPKLPKPKDAEVELALQLIRQIATEEFEPKKYKDEVKKRVAALIEQKVEGEEITAPEIEKPAAKVIDLMEALKASLGGKPGRAGKAASARATRTPRTRAAAKTTAKPRAAARVKRAARRKVG